MLRNKIIASAASLAVLSVLCMPVYAEDTALTVFGNNIKALNPEFRIKTTRSFKDFTDFLSDNAAINDYYITVDTVSADFDKKTLDTIFHVEYNLTPGEKQFILDSTFKPKLTSSGTVLSDLYFGTKDTVIEKLFKINNFITTKLEYSKETIDPYSAYTAFKTGKGVCSAYTELAKLYLDKAGIPNCVIYGTANGEPHTWNMVKVNDNWYHFDTTFNDTSKSLKYFLATDEDLLDRQYTKKYPTTVPLDGYFSIASTVAQRNGKSFFLNIQDSCLYKENSDSGDIVKLSDEKIQNFALTDEGSIIFVSDSGTYYISEYGYAPVKVSAEKLEIRDGKIYSAGEKADSSMTANKYKQVVTTYSYNKRYQLPKVEGWQYVSSNPAVARASSTSLLITGRGKCTIDANVNVNGYNMKIKVMELTVK